MNNARNFAVLPGGRYSGLVYWIDPIINETLLEAYPLRPQVSGHEYATRVRARSFDDRIHGAIRPALYAPLRLLSVSGHSGRWTKQCTR